MKITVQAIVKAPPQRGLERLYNARRHQIVECRVRRLAHNQIHRRFACGGRIHDEWKGWWGANPVYHSPVFVVTNHARAALPMEGGTIFHFVTDGIASALQQAFTAAKGKDVRLGGGATLIRQYLRAGLVDELHLVMTKKLLGSGERLFEGTDNMARDYECVESVASEAVTHVRLVKRDQT